MLKQVIAKAARHGSQLGAVAVVTTEPAAIVSGVEVATSTELRERSMITGPVENDSRAQRLSTHTDHAHRPSRNTRTGSSGRQMSSLPGNWSQNAT